ncbi:hypothetical protein PR202_ga15499 [Eleusine coracana subsp. coracana]|uniref:Pentatricopeptide repeat-containing protein n=1 Tax=Eleusine coracana subsp. coracana TaxID=191504 RepID=A0AAV5CJ69_ELECO|nr:hypothetical protein PR202_ga15499 [Eleusine coracana subsp. coracana]
MRKLLLRHCRLHRRIRTTTKSYTSVADPVAAATPEPPASTVLRTLAHLDAGELAATHGLYNYLIAACTKSKSLDDGRAVHAHLSASRLSTDAFLCNSLIHLYCACGAFRDARAVFDEMPARDVVSWTSLVAGYARNYMPEEALGLLPDMLRDRVTPNGFTFASLLKAAGSSTSHSAGEQVHALAVTCGWHEDVYVGSALLDMYARRGWMDEAVAVFHRLGSRNAVSWNALIAGFARKGDGETTLTTFAEMQRNGFEATHFTYSSVFSAIAGLGALEQGKWVHAHMQVWPETDCIRRQHHP